MLINKLIAWVWFLKRGRLIFFRCSLQRNCSVEVNNEIFGDPCPGTKKYIEAQYKCEGKWNFCQNIQYCQKRGSIVDVVNSRLVLVVVVSNTLVGCLRCTHYQNCSIPASTSMFGDPCPGTHKYLEAHYQCLPGKLDPTHYCLFDKILLELQHADIKYTLFECYILISMSSFFTSPNYTFYKVSKQNRPNTS